MRRIIPRRLGRRLLSSSGAAAAAKLKDKVCVVTGAAGGIGRASCILFAREGASVVCADMNQAGAEETAALVSGEGGEAIAVKVDVSKSAEVASMFARAEDSFKKVNVIFNNAGIMHPDDGGAVDTTDEIWDLTTNINVKGVFYGCKYGIPALRRAGGGSVINTASFVALLGAATPQLAYTASKGAVLAMTRELAVIHARENMRFNALCPGPLNTPLLQDFLDDEPKKQRRLVHVPVGRFGEASEMAKAALFLATDDSSYVTGSSFTVDGGITAAYVTSETQVDPFGGPKDL